MARSRVLRLPALVAALFLVAAAPAIAADAPGAEDATADLGSGAEVFGEAIEETPVLDFVFPVVGPVTFDETFGVCRDECSRAHEGVDIFTFGWKGVPVIAAHDGTVVRTTFDAQKAGCSITLEGEEFTSRYLHLNTDLPGTDTPGDTCFAPGITVGASVTAGTLLGWVGDTGNAEATVPHLHFEIRDEDGEAIDPYPTLEQARHVGHRWITPADLLDVTLAMYQGAQPTVLVVSTDDVARLVDGAGGAVRIDAPLVPYDPRDPGPARSALRDLGPERIIVLTDGDGPSFVDDLRAISPIVALSSFAPAVDEVVEDAGGSVNQPADEQLEAAPVDNAPEESEVPEGTVASVSPRFLTVIAGVRSSADASLSVLAEAVPGNAFPLLVGTSGAPGDPGVQVPDRLGEDASHGGLWWLAADGWRYAEDADEAPVPGIAYLDGGDLDPAAVAYLLSSAAAPPMPLWHNQPTSLPSRSL